jgi:hypothetical protein
MTAVTCIILLAVALYGIFTFKGERIRAGVMAGVPALLVMAALPFVVRGYRLDGRRLLVRRLLWETVIDLSGLRRARHDPEAMSGSIRTLGNGGLFSFTGRFRNRNLGSYRAWVTDPRLAVVIELEDRTLVVSPDRPRKMADALSRLAREEG